MKRQEIEQIIKGMTREAKVYWINVMVKQELISKSEAGFLLIYK